MDIADALRDRGARALAEVLCILKDAGRIASFSLYVEKETLTVGAKRADGSQQMWATMMEPADLAEVTVKLFRWMDET